MKNLIVCLIVICSLFLAGCPKAEKTARDFRAASAKIQIYAVELNRAHTAAFQNGEITREQLAELTGLIRRLSDGIDLYRSAVREAESFIKTGQTVPKDKFDLLRAVFSEKVIDAFFAVIAKINLVPGINTDAVKTILTGIRLAILKIEDAFAQTGAGLTRSER